MPGNKFILCVAALSALAGVNAIPQELLAMIHKRAPDPPRAMPESADDNDIRFQPVLDYDTDSCYNVPAIDADGNLAQGLPNTYTTNTADCREPENLDNQNVYSRTHCNNGWCAYMYEHYFEKDVGLEHVAGVASGHRHEWENIVVWVKDGDDMPTYVAASAHDGYETRENTDGNIKFEDSHAKIVYHKAGAGTHAFRFANGDDENEPENDQKRWIRGALIGFDGYPSVALRDRMIQNWADTGIKCKIESAIFAEYLEKAADGKIDGFDYNLD
ncbi:necrosis inducing protein-domain-containing protein [Xylariomycetidae sp. FL2044]|nr:necrosis inducing protein-domain-containing protein [Xylariomycetidae sp. FL2044]